jgi:Leucine-rich repeat (LRR) protein
MTDQQDSSIIKSNSTSLSKSATKGNPLLSRMTRDALTRVKTNQPTQERISLGSYSLCPPDYKQIAKWSEIIDIDPLELLKFFETTLCEPYHDGSLDPIQFEVISGSIRSLPWPVDSLGPLPNEWEAGLHILSLGICGATQSNITISGRNRPQLENLICADCDLDELIIEHMPSLKRLDCSGNNLLSVDIHDLTSIEVLACASNNLGTLGLDSNSQLLYLNCADNNLADLNLGAVPLLARLDCSQNELTSLDTKDLPSLEHLYCKSNMLSALDLQKAKRLKHLDCRNNRISELSLPLGLVYLDCSYNYLTRLDLPATLSHLYCQVNHIFQIKASHLRDTAQINCGAAVEIY